MYILNLDQVDRETPGVGLKAANLGFLMKSGFFVPAGFVVASDAFDKFLTDTGIGRELPAILGSANSEDPRTAFRAYDQIKGMFAKVSGNDFLIRELKGAYNEISFGKDISAAGGAALDLIRAGRGESFVSVRSSFSCQAAACFAGHGKAALNLVGHRQILSGIKDCWLFAFSPEAILYRKIRGIEQFSLSVIVQKMTDSELSGTLFTSEPVSGDRSKALAEGSWGLGETLSSGNVCPDQFLIDKEIGVVQKRISRKLFLRRRGPLSGITIQERVPLSRVSAETLNERDFSKFALIAKKVEDLMGSPQEIDWAVDRGRMAILQMSPAVFSKASTVAPSSENQVPAQENPEGLKAPDSTDQSVLPAFQGMEKSFSGIGVSAGAAKGKAVYFPDLSKLLVGGIAAFPQETILLVKSLSMDILPYLKWLSGIVSEQGGAGSRLASIAREFGIPIVAGIENAQIILNGRDIALDGLTGNVYSL